MSSPDGYFSAPSYGQGGGSEEPPKPATATARRGKRPEKPKTTKSSVRRNFVIAIVFAVAAAGVVYKFGMSNETPPADFVVVAQAGIPAGSTIDAGLLKAVRLDPAAVVDGAVSNADPQKAIDKVVADVSGRRTQYPIAGNEQIVPDQFTLPFANLGSPLTADERLVSFNANVSAAVAGTIKAGDRVDLYSVASGVAGLVVPDVQIVSVTVAEDRYNAVASDQESDKTLTPSEILPSQPVPGMYVARVATQDVAKILSTSAADDGIYLAYRGADAGDSSDVPESLMDLLCSRQNPESPLLLGCQDLNNAMNPDGAAATGTGTTGPGDTPPTS